MKPITRHLIKWLWISLAAGVVLVVIFLVLTYNGIIGHMPPIEDLKNPQDRYASVVYTEDGQEIGRFFSSTGNRVYADIDEVSPHVVDALISTEDVRFGEHSGIDMKAIARAMFKTVLMGDRSSGGGSTLTQQLAKQLYTNTSNSLWGRAFQKPTEWMIALKLERFYSKEEILKMYLNQFDFLYNAVGIKTAAKVYFNKDAKDLNVEEAATLVGMVKNPSYYNPIRHNERTRLRRNTVLEQMYKNDKLTKAELDSLSALPLTVNFQRVDHKEGLAPYFREELRRRLTAKEPVRENYPSWDEQRFQDDLYAWENDPLYGWIEKNPKADGTKYNIYTDGLKIYTTLDSRMQHYAEEAVNEHMTSLQGRFFNEKKNSATAPYTSDRSELSDKAREGLINAAIRQSERYRVAKLRDLTDAEIEQEFNTPIDMTVFSYKGPIDTIMSPKDSILYHKHFLRTGFMSMDARNGHIKAYVGGPDFRFFQYDMVSKGRRQVGSTIKPFLYTVAMEEGGTPCDMYLNAQPTLYDANGRPWSPRNSGKDRIGEMVNLRYALTTSNNWISARLINQYGPHAVAQLMRNMGITAKLDEVISLCLGPVDVSVREMVGAYSAFANEGIKVDPVMVTRIEDAQGNTIANFSTKTSEVISREAYYKMLSMLLGVVDGGTGSRLRRAPYNLTAQMGGKTGTTNSNSDGWFMSFTPDLVSGVWVGGEERYIHFNTMANGQGAEMALPIYGKYMSKVFNDSSLPYKQDSKFNFPSDIDLCAGAWVEEPESETAEETVSDVFD